MVDILFLNISSIDQAAPNGLFPSIQAKKEASALCKSASEYMFDEIRSAHLGQRAKKNHADDGSHSDHAYQAAAGQPGKKQAKNDAGAICKHAA